MSTVLYIVLNFLHNKTLGSDTNIFASVFQFLFPLASDAIQAFLSYQDVITLIYLELRRFSPTQGYASLVNITNNIILTNMQVTAIE